MANKLSSKDLIVLLLYSKGHNNRLCEPIEGKTRLMKMMFLFDKEIRRSFNLDKKIPESAFPNFEPYDYGPFSSQVYADLEFLVDMGFVSVTKKECSSEECVLESKEYEYWQANSGEEAVVEYVDEITTFSLTKLGRDFVEKKQLGDFTQNQWDILNKFKARCTGIALKALLRYVYNKYPEMATNSKILEEIIK